MTPQLNSNTPTEQLLGQATSDAQKAKVLYNIRSNSQFKDSSVFLKRIAILRMYERKYAGHVNCIFCPQRPKGKPIITYTQQAAAPKYPSALGSSSSSTSAYICCLCAISSCKSLLEEMAQEGKHKWIQLAFQPEFITLCSWGQEIVVVVVLLCFSKKYTRGKRKLSLPELLPVPADHKPIQGLWVTAWMCIFPEQRHPKQPH